ncbi:hypothetical protein B6U90_05245 [Thermoplasmatales archaeon ex4484_6]|nr:MAG: hypothetical protein B6U90_05245 [Thermoplasmatales archaeon ex4484_6]RLF68855.1 MAG: hypothetical protein DRN57_02685 [Thermoplasmata archaeon]
MGSPSYYVDLTIKWKVISSLRKLGTPSGLEAGKIFHDEQCGIPVGEMTVRTVSNPLDVEGEEAQSASSL